MKVDQPLFMLYLDLLESERDWLSFLEFSIWYIGQTDYKQMEEQAIVAKRAERVFSLIRWTGVDTRRSIVVEEEEGNEEAHG